MTTAAPPKPPTPPTPPTPPSRSGNSLYALACQVQEIDGELAVALELLDSDDPDEQRSGKDLIEGLLDPRHHSQEVFLAKADQVAHVVTMLRSKADVRSKEAKRITELVKSDLKAAERLEGYLLSMLSRVLPGSAQYSLKTHEISSRRSTGLELKRDEEYSQDFDLAVANDAALLGTPALLAIGMGDTEIPWHFFKVKVTAKPDKARIKAALKEGNKIPTADLQHNVNWSIK